VSTTARAGAALRCGALTALVRGGPVLEIASLTDRGDELLVPGTELPAAAAVHGGHGGIAFLHPWANRLGADRYALAGRQGVVAPDAPGVTRDDGGLAIHGLAAPGAGWTVTAQGDALARAHLAHEGADGSPFPFPHEVDVQVALAADGLTVSARITATTTQAVPVVVGWHPYLRLPGTPRPEWRLGAPPRDRLTATPDGLPDGGARAEPAEDAPLGTRTFDDGYRTGEGAAWTLAHERRTLRVRMAGGYPVSQLFAPDAVDVVSIEPMAAATDALRDGRGLAWARCGEPAVATFVLDVEPRGAPGYRLPG
jgi:galactose mutarotase-like enzyme